MNTCVLVLVLPLCIFTRRSLVCHSGSVNYLAADVGGEGRGRDKAPERKHFEEVLDFGLASLLMQLGQ